MKPLITVMKRILIIPDIHGRLFWKEVVGKVEVDHTIFLGDYLDPYPFEYIGADLAYNNFLEIIEYKKQNPDTTTLLLGNHDAHYLWLDDFGEYGRSNRYNYEKAPLYHKTFLDNKKLFILAWQEGKYLFTHAGVVRGWLKQNKLRGPRNPDRWAHWLNSFPHDPKLMRHLGDVGRSRGGYAPYGGPLWADIDEHYWSSLEGIYQVFGHSRSVYHYLAGDDCACLDCMRPFILLPETGIFGEVDCENSQKFWKELTS